MTSLQFCVASLVSRVSCLVSRVSSSVFDLPFSVSRLPAPISRLHVLGLLTLVAMLALIGWQFVPSPAQAGNCATGSAISETFATGARWELCWEELINEGVVLSEIYYTTPDNLRRKVLHEASLSQIEVIYDDGLAAFNYVSDPGLGGAQLLTLTAADCPDGSLLTTGERNVLCKQSGARGYLYKYYAVQRQGEGMTLYSASQIGQRIYLVRWRFLDDGTIEPMVGDGGRLLRQGQDDTVGWPIDADGTIGIGYVTNYWWRLDFDIGGNGANDHVDEFVVTPAGSTNQQRLTTATALTTESGRATDPDVKRSWRVRDGTLTNSDGRAISYHLEPKQAGYRYRGTDEEPWSQHDLYATVDHPCERLAIDNPTDPTCAAHVAAFVNEEALTGADVVLWYRLTTYRLPRAEDMPLLAVQWHGYQLLARDWTAQNPF